MALQIWLPLNGNLRNLGVSGIEFVKTGSPSLDDTGKVTRYCMKTNWTAVDNTKANNYHSSIKVPIPTNFSFSLWFKSTSSQASVQHIFQSWGTDYNGGTASNPVGIGLCINGNTFSLDLNSARHTVSTVSTNNWYHAVVTQENTTVKVYLNGELKLTKTRTSNYDANYLMYIGSLRDTYYTFFGSINDFRLYNHCLSAKEIKNLAKGLMLHYTLSRPQANLLKNTATEKAWTYSGTSYSDSNYSQDTITPSANSYYTMSFDAKSNRNSTSNFITYLFNNNSGRQCDSVQGYLDGKLIYTGTASDGACTMPTYTYYRHYTIVRHFNSNATALTKQNVFRIYNAGSSSLTMYVKNAKLELGNRATSWIPNSADTLYTTMGFNLNVEDDVSGYGNNGTRVNITTRDTDTPRYLTSTVFNGDNGAIKLPFDPSSFWVDFTISVWIYKTSIGTKSYQTIFGGPSGFELEARNNAETNPVVVLWNWGKGSGAYEFNKWNHVVMTRTLSGTKLYINGTQVATGTTGTIPSGDYFVGAWNTYNAQNFEGRMSDFRIYSTALSSEDVLELYQTSASMDKNNNVHCYELVEN